MLKNLLILVKWQKWVQNHLQKVTEDVMIPLRKTTSKEPCEVFRCIYGKCLYTGVGYAVYTDVCNHKLPFILISTTVKLFCWNRYY